MNKLKKGDKVKILLGKDRGKEGTLDFVVGKDNKGYVGGLNLYKRHVRKMGQTEGGIVDLPKPMNLSNLVLICPSCNKPTRVGFKIVDDKKLRVCKKCTKEITK